MDYKELCFKTIDIVKKTSVFVMTEYHKLKISDIVVKNKNDLVSYVDVETEKKLIKALSEILKESEFIAEETSNTNEEELKKDVPYWIIDPIDGTTNFIYKIPAFCTSIALMINDKIKIGVVYDMLHDECFYAYEGGNSYLNDKEIKVAKTPKLENALLATGFPYDRSNNLEEILNVLKFFLTKSQDIRRLGAAALDLVYVACGRFDGFWENSLKAWDVAAAAFIIEKAGGKVTDYKGGDNWLFDSNIIAANGFINDEMLEAF